MKIVKINESTIRKIVERILTEKVGVPDNIHEVSLKIFDGLIEGINPDATKDELENNTIDININDNINELDIDEVVIGFRFLEFTEIHPVAFQNVQQIRLSDDEIRMEYKSFEGTIKLNIVITVPEDVSGEDLINYFTENKRDTISTFSHELTHTYNHFKYNRPKVTDTVEYSTYSDRRFGINAIDNFLVNLYYTTLVENLVRPSEISSRMKYDKVDKENFYDYFFQDETIKNLLQIRDYSFEQLISDLRNEYTNCVEFLKQGKLYDRFMSKNDVIRTVLKIVYFNIINWKTEGVFEYLGLNDDSQIRTLILQLIGKEDNREEKIKFFEKYLARLRRFEGEPDDFFKHEIKYMSSVADKMIKKLSKLYSLIGESSSSIINFDLYHKLYKKTKPKFTKEIKQYSFSKKKL